MRANWCGIVENYLMIVVISVSFVVSSLEVFKAFIHMCFLVTHELVKGLEVIKNQTCFTQRELYTEMCKSFLSRIGHDFLLKKPFI